jgi:hypothetical protein
VTTCSSPPKQTSFNFSAASVLIFILSFKNLYRSNINTFLPFKQVVAHCLDVA